MARSAMNVILCLALTGATVAVRQKFEITDALDASVSSEALRSHAMQTLKSFTRLNVSAGKVESLLASSPRLREALSNDLILAKQASKARNKEALSSLLERVKESVTVEEASTLENSLRKKEITPCGCFVKSWNGFQIVNTDPANGWGPEGGEYSCKRDPKYKMDYDEAQVLGFDDWQSPVLAFQKPYPGSDMVQCLDIPQSIQQIRQFRMALAPIVEGNPRLDFVKELDGARDYVTAEQCLDECSNLCNTMDGVAGIDFTGLCLDEFWSD